MTKPETVQQFAQAFRDGKRSAVEIATLSLQRIHEQNKELGSYLHVADERVLAQAKGLDERRQQGTPLGMLAGVPLGLKDALCTHDMPTTCASRILEHEGKAWQPPYDATVVRKLREADALLVGKCNMDEFAMGSSTENSGFFPAKNPHDTSRTPGGSSGGSAVSVAASMTPTSLGTDTGGSIRQPAAFTGTVGVKPTYGRVSRYGLVAFASSLDQVGPFANDVQGAARVLQVIAGHDPKDATSLNVEVPDFIGACGLGVQGLRIGVPEEYFDGLDSKIASKLQSAIRVLEQAGATIHKLTLPHTKAAVAVYYVLATAEASSNLSRFDGVRFGKRVQPAGGDLGRMYEATRNAGFGSEVKRRILLGSYVLSAGYYDAYYLKAQKVRRLIAQDFQQAFEQVDIIASPTTTSVAYPLGSKVKDPLAMYLDDIYTLPASLAGIPAMSVPVAPCEACGSCPTLPVGIQLTAAHLQETQLFRAASVVEQAFS
jgi:aspartyl-tRNA(Asn)/glutamyl-tRNA(Gln) amidotransferase subunit A